MSVDRKIRLSGTNLERVADHNQRITLHAIRVNGSLTRVELARITGLTAPSIANIAKRLKAEGLISEAGRQRGGRGQPPTNLIINREACYSIGINVDRDHITFVIVDFLGQTIVRLSHDIDFALPKDVKALYQKSILKLIDEAQIDPSRLVGIGVAIPDELGHIDLPGRPANYNEWDTVHIPELFEEPLDLPIFVENDATAAAMGELQLGLGHKYNSFFYILLSSGLGGGLVIDGAYFRGAEGRSGELGFLLTKKPNGDTEQIQNIVSLSGLMAPLKEAGFNLNNLQHNTITPPRVEEIVDNWIETAVETLADPLVAINCLINPAAILMGGRLPSYYFDRFSTRMNQYLREKASNVPVLAPVVRASLSEDAPAVGAAILPFSHFLLPKPGTLWKAGETTAAAE